MSDDNVFESWDPDRFERDANHHKTIRTFTTGLITGDVLDVGCGSRVFYDTEQATSWTGVDRSARMLSGIEFTGEAPAPTLVQGDVLDLPFEDDSFDTVVTMFLLHHLGKWSRSTSAERVSAAFAEMNRVLRPGGRIIVGEVSPGPAEWPYHWAYPGFYALGRLAGTEMPYFWQPEQLARMGRSAGLDEPMWIRVPIRDRIYQPILRITLPGWVLRPWLLTMNLFTFDKPSTDP